MKKALITATALFAAAFSQSAAAETLMGYTTDFDGITFQVYSNGCTDKDSFNVMLLQTSPVKIVLDRKSPDNCRGFLLFGTKVTYGWDELGLQPGESFTLSNPLRGVNS